jgi:hypothetical protein
LVTPYQHFTDNPAGFISERCSPISPFTPPEDSEHPPHSVQPSRPRTVDALREIIVPGWRNAPERPQDLPPDVTSHDDELIAQFQVQESIERYLVGGNSIDGFTRESSGLALVESHNVDGVPMVGLDSYTSVVRQTRIPSNWPFREGDNETMFLEKDMVRIRMFHNRFAGLNRSQSVVHDDFVSYENSILLVPK